MNSGGSFIVKFTAPEDILELIPDKRKLNLKELGLNERQVEALRMMVNEKRVFTNALYQKTFGIARRTALRDLKGLVELNQIRMTGVGRGAKYKAI